MTKGIVITLWVFLSLIGLTAWTAAQENPKEATEWTKQANQTVLKDPVLKWNDKTDFENAKKGFIACDDPLIIYTKEGKPSFNMEMYKKFIPEGSPAPATVNPSLWRHAQLNNIAGLFKIRDRIYIVRGYDLANMAVIEGDSGYILIDSLSSIQQAEKAMGLVYKHLGEKPIKAVIITHPHGDHFNGILGLVKAEDVKAGKVKIITAEGFTEAALTEEALLGPAMIRRLIYQFGIGAGFNTKGVVDGGLGKFKLGGDLSFMAPTDEIKKTGETMTIDGVKFVFVSSPETEAPVEIECYLPQFKTLCVAENVNMTVHNLVPMRGTLTRDARTWAGAINEMMEMFPDAEIAFGMHFWPVWGKAEVRNWLEKQRDMLLYLHDQTVRLANLGYTGSEISQMVKLPPSLASEWFNRPYYGIIEYNVRAIYTRYLGWFEGNVANLNPLPPEETSVRMVELMGGADEVIKKARQAFEKGDYRWVAQLLNMVVFADPKNMDARNLEADALEQLGYQQESSIWRGAYLVGAKELRTGKNIGIFRRSLSFYGKLPLPSLMECIAASLNGPKADNKVMNINFIFPESDSRYLMQLKNSVVHNYKDRSEDNADVTVTVDKASFVKLVLLKTPVDEIMKAGLLKIEGNKERLKEFISLLDEFDGKFNIMLP